MSLGIRVAVGYARTSGAINPEASIPNQKFQIEEYCKRNGMILREIFVDECKSGTTVVGRTAYYEMNRLIERERIDCMLVTYLDRLSRDSQDFVKTIRELGRKEIEIISISERLNSKEMSPIQVAMHGLQVEMENKNRTNRLKEAKKQKEREGIYSKGGRVPYGYTRNQEGRLEINRKEAILVRRIYQAFVEFQSVGKIINALDERNLSYGAINKMLSNPIYTGSIYRYDKDLEEWILIAKGSHKKIVSQDLFDEVNEIVNRKKSACKRKKGVSYLGNGLINCKVCNDLLKGREQAYKCKCMTYNIDEIHEAIKACLTNQQKSNEKHEISEEQKTLETLLEMNALSYAQCKISSERYYYNEKKINGELKQLIQQSLNKTSFKAISYDYYFKKNQLKKLRELLIKEGTLFYIDEDKKLIIH